LSPPTSHPRHRPRPLALLGLLCVVALLPASAGELVDRIIVVVNDELVLESEVQEEIRLFIDLELASMPEGADKQQVMDSIRTDVVEGLVGRRLMDQAMARQGITVEDAEIDAQIAETARVNNITVDQLAKELARQGVPMDQFRREMREQIKQYKLFQAEIGTKIDVSEDQVRQRYNERHANQPEDPEYHLRVIVLHVPPGGGPEALEEVRVQAQTIKAEIEGGAAFADMAREHSTDPGIAAKGGEFGAVRLRSMIPEFSAAVQGLGVGQVSQPFEFRDALWLIQLHKITNAAATPYEEVRAQLFDELYREEEERQIGLWIEREKNSAHIEYLH